MKILILGAGQVGGTAAFSLAREEANEVTIVDSIRVGPLNLAADRLVERVRVRMAGDGAADQPCKPDDLTVVLYRRHR